MMPNSLRSLFVCVLILTTSVAYAADDRVQVLERAVQQRDQVIIELLERVEALERRVGVRPLETDDVKTPQQQEVAPVTEKDPTQAPGRVVVDEGAAERALERALTLEGVLLLPPGVLEIEPGLIYARQEDTAPSFVMAGGGVTASELERNVNNIAADLALRLGLPWDSQLEIGLPYRWLRIESVTNVGFVPTATLSESGNGWGDIRVGMARTLLHEDRTHPDLVGRLTWNTDSGDTQDNNLALGDGFEQLRASLSAIKRQDPIVFVGGLSYEHVFEEEQLQPGATVAANFGGFIALSPETSLNLAFYVVYQDETELSGVKIDGSDRTLASLIVGGSTLLAPGTLLNLSVGIGLTDDSDDFSLTLSAPIRLGG
ncbi:MAG: transporter [Candidatus Bathyarchaeota archaeon]|nr:transporter [Candidatus Bathyarchaeota archaeon]